MRHPCIVGVADAKIDARGCVEKNSSVLSVQKNCASEALSMSGLNFKDAGRSSSGKLPELWTKGYRFQNKCFVAFP